MLKVLIHISIYLVMIGAGGFYAQQKLVFYPESIEPDFHFKFEVLSEEKLIPYAEGRVVHGLLFRPENPVIRILYFHGNGGALDSWGYVGSDLAQTLRGEVLMVDYPGFGKSSAGLAFGTQELYASADAAYAEIQKSTDNKKPLYLYGRSLGTGMASYLATRYPAQGLILEAPYVSIAAMAARIIPYFPPFLTRYALDNSGNLKNVKMPVLIIHGTADEVVPYAHGAQLAQENPAAIFVAIEKGDHNNLSDHPEYIAALQDFLKKHR